MINRKKERKKERKAFVKTASKKASSTEWKVGRVGRSFKLAETVPLCVLLLRLSVYSLFPVLRQVALFLPLEKASSQRKGNKKDSTNNIRPPLIIGP